MLYFTQLASPAAFGILLLAVLTIFCAALYANAKHAKLKTWKSVTVVYTIALVFSLNLFSQPQSSFGNSSIAEQLESKATVTVSVVQQAINFAERIYTLFH